LRHADEVLETGAIAEAGGCRKFVEGCGVRAGARGRSLDSPGCITSGGSAPVRYA
jgi:hypothetical protein